MSPPPTHIHLTAGSWAGRDPMGDGDAASPFPTHTRLTTSQIAGKEPLRVCAGLPPSCPPPSLNLMASHSARKLGARKKREVKVKTPWVVTKTWNARNYFLGKYVKTQDATLFVKCAQTRDAKAFQGHTPSSAFMY